MTLPVRVLLLAFVATGCGEGHAALTSDSARMDSLASARQDSINRAQPGYIVDSILPMEEQLRRFRANLTVPTVLEGGATSRDELVSSFVGSLESADTAALLRLTISRAEFAYLVFPDSPLSAPPYAQAPDLVWMRHTTASGTGLKRLLARAGGASLDFRSWSCSALPEKQGVNRVWGGCKVRFATGGATEQTLQLFASIIERQGRFKILSYANAF
jgi:hypothetical protein